MDLESDFTGEMYIAQWQNEIKYRNCSEQIHSY